MSSSSVNFNALMGEIGGLGDIDTAVRDAFETEQTARTRNVDPTASDGFFAELTAENLLGSDGEFALNLTGAGDIAQGVFDDGINDLIGGNPAIGAKNNIQAGLDILDDLNASYDALQGDQTLDGLPKAINDVGKIATSAAQLIGNAGNLLSLAPNPAAQLAAGNLAALSKALSTMGQELAAKLNKVATELQNYLDGRSEATGYGSFGGLDLDSPAVRACAEEFIASVLPPPAPPNPVETPSDDDGTDGTTVQNPNDTKPDPLIIDLDGDGVELTPIRDPSVFFSFFELGTSFQTAWVSPDDGIIVNDIDQSGAIETSEEFFGDQIIDAFTDLATFDDNADGIIDYNDAVWTTMRLWQDLNVNGVTDDGELVAMSEAGIASISLDRQEGDTLSSGSLVGATGTYTRTDGREGEAWAVFLDANLNNSRIEYPDDFNSASELYDLPFLKSRGNIPSLDLAMSEDSQLFAMVTELFDGFLENSYSQNRAGFEDVLWQWAGMGDGERTSLQKELLLEKAFATEFTYSTSTFDLANRWSVEARAEFDFNSYLESMLMRFTFQVVNLKLAQAETPEDFRAILDHPLKAIANMFVGDEDELVFGAPLGSIYNLSLSLPDDKLEAFEYIIDTVPYLLGTRQEFYLPENSDVRFPANGQRDFTSDLWSVTGDHASTFFGDTEKYFNDDMTSLFIYYRTIAEVSVNGDQGDNILAPEKLNYHSSALRDNSFFDGGLGDDFLIVQPWVSTRDSLTGEPLTYGSQQTTTILYRAGDGNDTIDVIHAKGLVQLFLPNIASADASLTVAPDGGGNAVLTLADGATIRINGMSNIDIDFNIFFEDGVVINQDNVRLQFTDNNDTLLGTNREDDIQGGLGDDLLIGGDGTDGFDTYHYYRGDGNDVIDDNAYGVGGVSGVANGSLTVVNYLKLYEIDPSEVRFSQVPNTTTMLISFEYADETGASSTDSITLLRQYQSVSNISSIPYPVFETIEFQDGTILTSQDMFLLANQRLLTEGDDIITGSGINDTLFFSNGDDTLIDARGDETYIRQLGVTGNDRLEDSGNGFNTLRLVGLTKDDVTIMLFADSTDVRLGLPEGSVLIVGQRESNGPKIDLITFGDGTEWTAADLMLEITAVSGTDAIVQGAGGDVNGTDDSDDSLIGSDLDEVFDGRDGSDLYFWNTDNSGNDIIDDSGASSWVTPDRLVLDALQSIFEFTRNGNDLIISTSTNDNTLTIENQFSSNGTTIEEIQFSDGVTYRAAEINEIVYIRGTDTSESVTGLNNSNDQIDGQAGDDILQGRTGEDTYFFELGDGNDEVRESALGENTIDLNLFSRAEIEVWRDGANGNDLILGYGDQGDTVRLDNYFTNGDGIRTVNWIKLRGEDLISIDDLYAVNLVRGTDDAETVGGREGNDRIESLGGNDQILGGSGDDTFVWGAGDGNDEIIDLGLNAWTNSIELRDLNRDDVNFSSDGRDLVLTVNATGETLTVIDQFGEYLSRNRHEGVEKILFSDGEIIDGQVALQRLAPFVGTAGDDILNAGRGDDGYLWGTGRGNDIIRPSGLVENHDILVLEDLTPEDVTIARAGGFVEGSGFDLRITINATGETLLIDDVLQNTFSFTQTPTLDEIYFSNGVVMAISDLQVDLPFTGTDGIDDINGNGRDNVFDLGTGDDHAAGLGGADTYIWESGDGNDVIDEVFTQTITTDNGSNVELEEDDFDGELEFSGEGEGGESNFTETTIDTPILSYGDTLILRGVSEAQVTFARAPDNLDDLLVLIGNAGETSVIHVPLHFVDPLAGIERIIFSDATLSAVEITDILGSRVTVGTAQSDVMLGDWGADTFDPGAGDDIIETRGGTDTIRIGLGGGNDTIRDFSGGPFGTFIALDPPVFNDFEMLLAAVSIDGGDLLLRISDSQSLRFENTALSALSPENFGFERAPIVGTDDIDLLVGSLLDDQIEGRGGKDELIGRAGDDNLLGGTGDDTLIGGRGADVLTSGLGADTIIGYVSDFHGDIVTDFDTLDRLVVKGNLGVTDVSFEVLADKTIVQLGTSELTLNGDFTGFSFEASITSDFDVRIAVVENLAQQPNAVQDTYSIDQGTSLSGNILANDTDPNTSGSIRLTSVSGVMINGPTMVTLNTDLGTDLFFEFNENGSFNFLAAGFDQLGEGFEDTVSFTYTIKNAAELDDTTTATFTINGLNDAPEIVNLDFGTVLETAGTVSYLIEGLSDVDGDDLITSNLQISTDGMQIAANLENNAITLDTSVLIQELMDGDSQVLQFEFDISDGRATSVGTARLVIEGESDIIVAPEQIVGSDSNDVLVGSNSDEVFTPGSGIYDRMTGGGGADTFLFLEEGTNGHIERNIIIDFDTSNDSLDFSENSYTVRMIGSTGLVRFGDDGDLLYLRGSNLSRDEIIASIEGFDELILV